RIVNIRKFSATRSAYLSLRSNQKPPRSTSAYTIWINRPAGRALAALLSSTRATPNQVSITSAILSFAGLAAIWLLGPTLPAVVTGASACAVAYVLDSADGQLARLTGTGSSRGEW